jgi:hypothetical protein
MMSNFSSASVPWLSVVIPSYCGEQWIDAALSSIAAERAEGIEVLLIDGSPTDATLDIANTFSDRLSIRAFKRVDLKLWHTKTNFGVSNARAPHVCWLGVDDVWLPGRAAACRAWIEAAAAAPLHLASSAIIDKFGRRLAVWRCPLHAGSEIKSSVVIERLLVQNFIGAPAPVFRKDAWLQCGGLDEGLWYTADWDMWLKLAALGSVYYHEPVTVGFRIHGGSLTVTGSRNRLDFEQQMLTVLSRHIGKVDGGRHGIESIARASIAMNTALAMTSGGDASGLVRAAVQILRLGPFGMRRFFRDSRILERAGARVRAKLKGTF